MGDFATTTSFSKLLPNFLKGNTITSDSLGTEIIDAQITRAEADVTSAIAARYTLPFSTGSVPPKATKITEDLTMCFMIQGSYVQDGQITNDYWQGFCKRANQDLEDLRNGKIKLTNTDGSIISPKVDSRYLISTENYAPYFNVDSPKNWKVSQNQKDDVESEREAAD